MNQKDLTRLLVKIKYKEAVHSLDSLQFVEKIASGVNYLVAIQIQNQNGYGRTWEDENEEYAGMI